jgi:hypothetical protein
MGSYRIRPDLVIETDCPDSLPHTPREQLPARLEAVAFQEDNDVVRRLPFDLARAAAAMAARDQAG